MLDVGCWMLGVDLGLLCASCEGANSNVSYLVVGIECNTATYEFYLVQYNHERN